MIFMKNAINPTIIFFKLIYQSILNSYAQIFFSNHHFFGYILLFVSFLDINAGLSGLLAVILSNTIAYFFGYSEHNIKMGYYGFNSLLVGLGLGIYYIPGFEYTTLLFFASILTLFISISLEGVIGKYALPYLSIPFILGIWITTLATREFTALEISEKGVYTLNEMYAMGGGTFVKIYEYFNNITWHESIIIYFKSLGAIFFQYTIFSGILITIGLLIYSRIAFSLSIIGYFSAYFFYQLFGSDITELSYSYIGFNYILTSIAIGGFFVLPSKYSYLWTILIIPLISFFVTAGTAIFSVFQLPIYSLPFNLAVLLFLYILKLRIKPNRGLELVFSQENSPEKNLYANQNFRSRFQNSTFVSLSLPFWGKWIISQGHNGDITHKDEWQHAWDFVIEDNDKKTYKDQGRTVNEYYCYNKPLLAPADGTIEEIIDNVEDNAIGDINTKQNWGNTIIIKHAENFYTKISHIKKGTFKHYKGEGVKRGDIVAYCGNTGRSPEPHVHFQIQATPYVGSKTLKAPFGHYVLHNELKNTFELKSYEIPKEREMISNIQRTQLLYKAFHFIPGRELKFLVNNGKTEYIIHWEIFTDIYNKTYIYEKETNAIAYFNNEQNLHIFTHYKGKSNTLLYYFFMAAYKTPLGYYKNLTVTDNYSLDFIHKNLWLYLQDFIAPFYVFLKPKFKLWFSYIDSDINTTEIKINSQASINSKTKNKKHLNFETIIKNNTIHTFSINTQNKTIKAIIQKK